MMTNSQVFRVFHHKLISFHLRLSLEMFIKERNKKLLNIRKLAGKKNPLIQRKVFYLNLEMACDRDQDKDLNRLNVSLSTEEQ